jgi:hypothetical protein
LLQVVAVAALIWAAAVEQVVCYKVHLPLKVEHMQLL